jgi:preprotein translocase subunit YajC
MMFVVMQAGGAQGGSFVSLSVTMGLMFLVFWLLVWRPQQKERETHERMVSNLKVGDEVVTTGGLLGKVVKAEEKILTLEIAKGVQVRQARTSVQALVDETKIAAKVEIVEDKKG